MGYYLDVCVKIIAQRARRFPSSQEFASPSLWALPLEMQRLYIPGTGTCWLSAVDLSHDSFEELQEREKIERNASQCFLNVRKVFAVPK